MNKKYFNIIVVSFLYMLIFACKEERMQPLPNDGKIPEKVSGIQVEPLAGSVRLTYDLPYDRSLSYVLAEWVSSNGKTRNAKGSPFDNNLLINGFGDTLEYDINIYSVSKGEKRSEPITIKVKPLTPPIFTSFESLIVTPDFGGCNVKFKNESGSNIVICVITPDSVTNEMVTAFNFYTQQTEAQFSVRGYSSEKRKFGFFTKDRWDNHSDTLYVELTPFYEEKIDKANFKEQFLTGDINNSTRETMPNLWDDNVATRYISLPNVEPMMPGVSFAFDMGRTCQLSRFTLWQRYTDRMSNAFNVANPRLFEVWGTNEKPNQDGSWDDWTKLLDCEIKKPSGLPLGEMSDDDIALTIAGSNFTFNPGTPPVRYLRFKINEVWGGTNYIYFNELTFWGEMQ